MLDFCAMFRELFPRGKWMTLFAERDLPILKYETTAFFVITTLTVLTIYFNVARVQFRLSRLSKSDDESRNALFASLNTMSKVNAKRITTLTNLFLLHAWIVWMIDAGLSIFYHAYISTADFDWDFDVDFASGSEFAGFALAITASIALGVVIAVVIFSYLPYLQLYALTSRLAAHVRRRGRASLDNLLPGVRLGAAHMSLTWANICFVTVAYFPTISTGGATTYLLLAEFAICSCCTWLTATKLLVACEENLADVEFMKVPWVATWFSRRLPRGSSLSASAFLKETLPVLEATVMDEKTEKTELLVDVN